MIRKEKLEELKTIIEELKVIDIKKREEASKFLSSEAYNIYLNNGIVLPREKLIKGGTDGSAAIIMPVTNDNEIITVIEPRVFTKNKVCVGFPAGYINLNEDIKLGALRELKEETGYVPETILKLDSFYQDEGCSAAYNHIFLALNCAKKYSQLLDKDEVIRYMKFNYEELLELEQMGYICSSNNKLVLAKTKKYMEGR